MRLADLKWQDRVKVDGWPSRNCVYLTDEQTQLCLRLVEYSKGATEPRHVHDGTHAATLLKGRAIVDGLTLGPLDVIVGPGGEPHGPMHYPEGVNIFSAFLGSFFHSEVQKGITGKQYRLVQAGQLSWEAGAGGEQTKTLVDHGCGTLLEQVMRYPAGARVAAQTNPNLHAALILDGSAVIEDETLGVWDLFYVQAGVERGEVSFPKGATLLVVTMR